MRQDLVSPNLFDIDLKSGRMSHVRKILSDEFIVTVNGALVNFLDANGEDRAVVLPERQDGLFYVIANVGTTGDLNVEDLDTTAVAVVSPGQTLFTFASEEEWQGTKSTTNLDVFTNTVDGLVPAPNSVTPGSLFLRDDGEWGQIQVTGIVDSFKYMTDGTNIATGSGPDTFKLWSPDGSLSVLVTNSEVLHGDNVRLQVDETNVDHDALLNYSADEHVAHSSIDIIAGVGLSGGGTIDASRTLTFAPGELTTNASPVLTDYSVQELAGGGARKTRLSVINTILDHNTLLNYVADQHVAHSGVSVIAGVGMSGGGTIAASRTLNLDLTVLPTDDTITATDLIPFYDTSESDHGTNTFAQVNAAIDHNTLNNYVADQHVAHSSVSISTTEGVQGGGTIAATRTLKLDISGLTEDTTPSSSDYLTTYDVSAGLHKKVLISNVASAVFVSDAPPGSPSDNSLWWESDAGILYIRYNDGSSTQWVQVSSSGGTDISGTVQYGVEQTKTDVEKAQARENIEAAHVTAMKALNAVVNGGMVVSQELGTTAATLVTNISKFIVDEWKATYKCSTGVVTAAQVQNTSFPTAIINGQASWGLRMTATTALASLANDDHAAFYQTIEGYRTASWQWGSAAAKTIMVSFFLYSTGAGTAFCKFSNSVADRNYYKEITVAAGWNFFCFTVPGDTSGTWDWTTGIGTYFIVNVAGKSASPVAPNAWTATSTVQTTNSTQNMLDTNNDVVILTNVIIVPVENDTQLFTYNETPYMMRSYDEEILTCLRYWRLLEKSPMGRFESATRLCFAVSYDIPMRTTPTASILGTITVRDFVAGGSVTATTPTVTTPFASSRGAYFELTAASFSTPPTGGNMGALISTAGNGVALSARS